MGITWPQFTLIISGRTYLQVQLHFEVLEERISTYEFGEIQFVHAAAAKLDMTEATSHIRTMN